MKKNGYLSPTFYNCPQSPPTSGLFHGRHMAASQGAYHFKVNPRGETPMEIHVHVHYHPDPETLNLLRRIDKRTITIMTDLTRLTSEVSEIGTTVDSAVALLGQLAQLIRDNATDPAALNSLADTLDSKGNELAAAVVANTPQEPAPTP